jgi:succinoglycan biosynthesis protein ExoA
MPTAHRPDQRLSLSVGAHGQESTAPASLTRRLFLGRLGGVATLTLAARVGEWPARPGAPGLEAEGAEVGPESPEQRRAQAYEVRDQTALCHQDRPPPAHPTKVSVSKDIPLQPGHQSDDQNMVPFVSVLVPMFNEERYITRCLESLFRQDYPRDRYEILVIDGDSSDASPTLVAQMRTQHPEIRILRNQGRFVAKALNMGIRQARGEIIVRMDAHAAAPPHYISVCVKYLLADQIDHVGGIMKPVGNSYWGQSIALATSCPFGIGNSKHRTSRRKGDDEAGWLGAFWKKTLLAIGGYDESMRVNEDDDLSYRLLKEGKKILRTPELEIIYFCRSSLAGLWIQYFRYGFWKVSVIQKYGKLTSIRHLVPAGFVLILVTALSFSFFSPYFSYLLLAILGMYALVSSTCALHVALKSGFHYVLSLPIIFLTLHLSYGTGFILGLL